MLNVYNHERIVTDYDIINYELYDRRVFRTQSDVYDRVFCKKFWQKAPMSMFDGALDTPLYEIQDFLWMFF